MLGIVVGLFAGSVPVADAARCAVTVMINGGQPLCAMWVSNFGCERAPQLCIAGYGFSPSLPAGPTDGGSMPRSGPGSGSVSDDPIPADCADIDKAIARQNVINADIRVAIAQVDASLAEIDRLLNTTLSMQNEFAVERAFTEKCSLYDSLVDMRTDCRDPDGFRHRPCRPRPPSRTEVLMKPACDAARVSFQQFMQEKGRADEFSSKLKNNKAMLEGQKRRGERHVDRLRTQQVNCLLN